MNWKKIVEANEPKNLWYEAHGISLHSHMWDCDASHTVLFIHGSLANNVWWQHIACQLRKGRVLSLSLSGHGLSKWDDSYSLEKHAEEVMVLLDNYQVGEVYIIGHSYGGVVASYVSTKRAVKQVVLVDTPMHFGAESFLPQLKKTTVYPSKEEAVKHFRPLPPQPVVDEVLLQWVASLSIREVAGGYTWQFDPKFLKREISPKNVKDIMDVLPGVQYWYAENSPFVTPEVLQKAKKWGIQCERLEKAHHAVMLDVPEVLLEKIKRLLGE